VRIRNYIATDPTKEQFSTLVVHVLTVPGCLLTTPAAPLDQEYTFFEPELVVPIPEYLINPACTLTDTLSLSLTNGDPLPSFITLDLATRSVKIVGSNVEEAGVYAVLITSTFEGQVDTSVSF